MAKNPHALPSEELKYFFIHIPKNGGMTIRKSEYIKGNIAIANRRNHKSEMYSAMVLQTMKANKDHHGFEHARYRDIHDTFKTTQQGTIKFFAITRNPWSRVASRYMYAKDAMARGSTFAPKSYADVSSLEAFIEERHHWGNKEYMWHRAIRGWYNAYDYIIDDNEHPRCDMLRLDNLGEDCKNYFNISKMSRSRNVAESDYSYKDLYTDKTIQIIADWYKKDIDHWGYDFDSSATKNYWAENI
jgi:hypothetical protein